MGGFSKVGVEPLKSSTVPIVNQLMTGTGLHGWPIREASDSHDRSTHEPRR